MAAKITPKLKLQYVFYAVGLIFLFATLVYFAYEYVLDLSNTAKTIILGCLVVVFFFAGELLREKDV